jgi:cytochrome c oxidase subunit 3
VTVSSAIGVKVEEQFANEKHQRETAKLGIWLFLSTELLIFSGMFICALVLRVMHPHAVAATAKHLQFWIGATNTGVLILSSFTMSVAIEASRLGERRIVLGSMLVTAGLGGVFLCLKAYEYYRDWAGHMMPFFGGKYALAADPPSRLFLDLYYLITGVHAIHLSIGIGLMLYMANAARKPDFLKKHQNRVEISGLYWHFIDLIWIIVFPTLYLLNK